MNNEPFINEDSIEEYSMPRASFTELLGQMVNQSSVLVKDEIALVKQEAREKLEDLKIGAAIIAVGAVLCFFAIAALWVAAIIALTAYMDPAIAALVMAVTLGVIGGVVVYFGIRELKGVGPTNSSDTFDH